MCTMCTPYSYNGAAACKKINSIFKCSRNPLLNEFIHMSMYWVDWRVCARKDS